MSLISNINTDLINKTLISEYLNYLPNINLPNINLSNINLSNVNLSNINPLKLDKDNNPNEANKADKSIDTL